MNRKTLFSLISMLAAFTLLLAACAPRRQRRPRPPNRPQFQPKRPRL